jgi:hypothetical protein
MPRRIESNDDQKRLDNDIRRNVKVGEDARVSLCGIRQDVLEVIGIGKDGITGRTDDGRKYKIRWKHVGGHVGKRKEPPMVKLVKSILFAGDDDQRIKACAPPETTEQEVKRKIPAEVLAHHRRR